jgi:hypothetical protein
MNNITEPDMRLARTLFTIALALAVAAAGQAFAGDLLIERPNPAFGLVGITPSETARLNAVLLLPAVQPFTTPSCVVEMRFIDNAGRTLAVAQKVHLRPNEAVLLDLPGTQAYMWQPLRGNRSQIRAEIRTLEPGVVCPVAQTLELFDTATGKTSVVINAIR